MEDKNKEIAAIRHNDKHVFLILLQEANSALFLADIVVPKSNVPVFGGKGSEMAFLETRKRYQRYHLVLFHLYCQFHFFSLWKDWKSFLKESYNCQQWVKMSNLVDRKV